MFDYRTDLAPYQQGIKEIARRAGPRRYLAQDMRGRGKRMVVQVFARSAIEVRHAHIEPDDSSRLENTQLTGRHQAVVYSDVKLRDRIRGFAVPVRARELQPASPRWNHRGHRWCHRVCGRQW